MYAIERNELFDLAYRFVTETNESVFLTGKAGTGKTTFLKYLKETCPKNIVVAAPTGVAAINAGGVTLHSLFQLPLYPFLPSANNKKDLVVKVRFSKQKQELLRKMELLVIDEISMVRCDLVDAIDCLLKSVRRNHHLPFGGVQVLYIGDLYQLPPVVQNKEWQIINEYYNSPFFFDSLAIKEQAPLLIELNKIYRQKEGSFIALLNKVRNNEMGPGDFDELHKRFIPGFRPAEDGGYITLTSHNKQADLINQQELYKLPSVPFSYNAFIEGDFPESLFPAEAELVLKEGAQVMFLKNDPVQKRYFNGKIGVVRSLEKEKIIVDCDGSGIDVPAEIWQNTRYVLNRADGKLEQEDLGSFRQYPLRLAWAITIHKSQGLTFDRVMIDAAAAFSNGQVYVALSRCTSLEGIVLLSKIPPAAINSSVSVTKGQEMLSARNSLTERFSIARQAFTQLLLEDIFSYRDVGLSLEHLLSSITIHQKKLNSGATEWVKKFSDDFHSCKAVGQKFLRVIDGLMKTDPVVESNLSLQGRIADASVHFLPRFVSLLENLKKHPVITEHREVASVVDDCLQTLSRAISATIYMLEYCKNPFTVIGFLQHRVGLSQSRINLSCYAGGKKESYSDSVNPELYDALKRWRDGVCTDSGLPIFLVANRTLLLDICSFLPRNKKDLEMLGGFGKVKVEKYGDDILEIVDSFCSRVGLETKMQEFSSRSKKEKVRSSSKKGADTKSISFSLYKEGKDIAAISKERNLSTGTIEGHLSYFIGQGLIPIDDFVDKEKQQMIIEVAARLGRSSLKMMAENLPQGTSYGEIRMVLASNNVQNPGI